MLELSRTVRFCIDFAPDAADAATSAPKHNTYAAYPSMIGLGAYYEVTVSTRGDADPTTGYVIDIGTIDAAVRDDAVPAIAAAIRANPGRDPAVILRDVTATLAARLDRRVTSVRWSLTPYYSLTMRPDAMNRVILNQSFDFAAAHRLHSSALSEQDNRAIFGACNNPNGHGHNYRLQIEASTALADDGAARPFTLAALERIVDETVIRRFDHTHLNLDTDEFANLNPSVEHIARVCHDLLAEPLGEAGGRLERVTVWETDRTCCTYPA